VSVAFPIYIVTAASARFCVRRYTPLEPLVDLPRHRWSAVEITGDRSLSSCGHSNYNFVSVWGNENCLKNMLAAVLCTLLLPLPLPLPPLVARSVCVRLKNVWCISALQLSHLVWRRTFVVLWFALPFFTFLWLSEAGVWWLWRGTIDLEGTSLSPWRRGALSFPLKSE
jgi:hypothetical protein